MKLRTKLLVSNREQTKIQVSLSPPYPSPHPAHQQQMRNTAKAPCVVFCSGAGPNPQAPQPVTCPVGRGARDAFGGGRILRGWGGGREGAGGRGGSFAILRLLFRSSPAIFPAPSLPWAGAPTGVAPTQLWAVNCPSLLGSLSHSRRLRSPLPPH